MSDEDLPERARLLRGPRLGRGREARRTSAILPAASARAKSPGRPSPTSTSSPSRRRSVEVENECVSPSITVPSGRSTRPSSGRLMYASISRRSTSSAVALEHPLDVVEGAGPRPGCPTRAPSAPIVRTCSMSVFGGDLGRQRRLQRIPIAPRAPRHALAPRSPRPASSTLAQLITRRPSSRSSIIAMSRRVSGMADAERPRPSPPSRRAARPTSVLRLRTARSRQMPVLVLVCCAVVLADDRHGARAGGRVTAPRGAVARRGRTRRTARAGCRPPRPRAMLSTHEGDEHLLDLGRPLHDLVHVGVDDGGGDERARRRRAWPTCSRGCCR